MFLSDKKERKLVCNLLTDTISAEECKESAHNIFRLLMSRDLNLHSLQGVIFDHACGLDQYILNREPSEFEFLRCLVDGAHWQVNSFMMIMVIK